MEMHSALGRRDLWDKYLDWQVYKLFLILHLNHLDHLPHTNFSFFQAYAGDSLVAISAGQLASLAATKRGGPTGPFELSIVFLVLGALLASWRWKENVAQVENNSTSNNNQATTIRDAAEKVIQDPNIALVGMVQSLFEAAMYIFVLQWPPVISAALSSAYGSTAAVPYGTIFSCFMASCLAGSTVFSKLTALKVRNEKSSFMMLLMSTVAMAVASTAARGTAGLGALVASFFVFEAAVGFYFPSIGTLRSRYLPDSHRSVIMNLFGIPLNALVVTVFLSIHKLGVSGALQVATGALAIATACMFQLARTTSSPKNA